MRTECQGPGPSFPPPPPCGQEVPPTRKLELPEKSITNPERPSTQGLVGCFVEFVDQGNPVEKHPAGLLFPCHCPEWSRPQRREDQNLPRLLRISLRLVPGTRTCRLLSVAAAHASGKKNTAPGKCETPLATSPWGN